MSHSSKISSLLLIDNFDSFTYNIVQAYQCLGAKVEVVRPHAITLEEIRAHSPDLLVLGPGPGHPAATNLSKFIALAEEGIAIFGICLGHQAIGEAFGGTVVRAEKVMHGKSSAIYHAGEGVFAGLAPVFRAIRYHSLIIDPSSLPAMLKVTAWTQENLIMAISHRTLPIQGVQFHPESIASEEGVSLLRNSLMQKHFKE